MLKRIHVNRIALAQNRHDDENRPVLTVKTYKRNTKCHRVEINGPSVLVYQPDKPLACGARVWIETDAPVATYLDGGGMPDTMEVIP